MNVDDFDDIGPDNGLGDELDYSESNGLKKKLPWIAVIGAYCLTFGGIAGVIVYLMMNADQIEEERRADRPHLNIEQLKMQNVAALPATGDGASPDDQQTKESQATDDDNHGEDGENMAAKSTAKEKSTDEDTADQDTVADVKNADGPIEADNDNMLQAYPDVALVEETADGPLPKIGEDGRKPWQVYSRPVNLSEQRLKIAIVVTNLGISDEQTADAITLPGSMSLAFAPYSPKLNDWISDARNAGHEVLLTLPMEPADFPKSDPGPFALLSTLDDNQNLKRLEWILTRGTGYVGLVNFMGSKFSLNEEMMTPIFAIIKARGLAYLDVKETKADIVSKMATKIGVPNISADLLIDENLSRAGVVAGLARVENLAKTNGFAIAIARPYPVTLGRLKIWARDLQAKGMVLVPISSLIYPPKPIPVNQ